MLQHCFLRICQLYTLILCAPINVFAQQENVLSEDAIKITAPAYRTDSFPNVYYKNWSDFLELKAEPHQTIGKKDNKIMRTKINARGQIVYKPIKENFKVLTCRNLMFFISDNYYYPMVKEGGDFFIKAKLMPDYDPFSRSPYNSKPRKYSNVDGFFDTAAYYKFKINPRNGNLIPVHKIALPDSSKSKDNF